MKKNWTKKHGTKVTLKMRDGAYEGHDLHGHGMATIYAVGRNPKEAIMALCKARLGKFEEDMEEISILVPELNPYSWVYSFKADGTARKAAGIHVPGGVILTWWK